MPKITKYPLVARDHNGVKQPIGPVVFTNSDAGVGDILMIRDSLGGRPASHISIDATGALTVQFNVIKQVFPPRKPGEGFSEVMTGYQNVGQVQEYIASGEVSSYALTAGETLELDGEFPVSDIYIEAGATDFTILVS